MSTHEHTTYDLTRVGKGYRKFNGKLYAFWYTATMKGSFADNGSQKHEQEVQMKAELLRSQGYKVRVVLNNKADSLFYVHGERTQ